MLRSYLSFCTIQQVQDSQAAKGTKKMRRKFTTPRASELGDVAGDIKVLGETVGVSVVAIGDNVVGDKVVGDVVFGDLGTLSGTMML